jgi:hypothetical protein
VDFELPPGSEVFGAEAYVFGAGRIHADDTTVEVLAKRKTIAGRIWTYVRGDRPFATVVRTTFDDNGLSTVKRPNSGSRQRCLFAAAAELSSTVGVGFIGTGPSWKKTRPEVTGTAIARPKSRKS